MDRRPAAFAALAIVTGILLGFAGWPQAQRTVEFTGLIAAAILAAAFALKGAPADDRPFLPIAFGIDFTSLLLFGAHPTMLVAIAGTVTRGLTSFRPPRQTLIRVAIALAATQAAGFIHRSLGGTTGELMWPWQAVPIAAAVIGYSFAAAALSDVVVPLVARQPVDRSWATRALRDCPLYFIAASIAVGAVEVIDRRAWEILPVVALPVYLAYRTYGDYVARLVEQRRQREVVAFVEQGMCVLDGRGRVTIWDQALERILDCPRRQVMGQTLAAAVPAVRRTQIPQAVEEAITKRSPRTLEHVAVRVAEDQERRNERILQVTIVPIDSGVTLLFHDVTTRARTEIALKRSGDRLALAAEGANDGLWEWDLRTQEIYFSRRWREMIGLFVPAGTGRAEDWLDRVHPDDVDGLKKALEAHLAGKAHTFHHEHRLRHENGTYRRFLCRGIAVRGTQRRPTRIAGSLTDTTEHAIAQEQIRSAGFLDPLTGLCNRAVFVEGLGRRLDELKDRRGAGRFAVLYLDLDRFKIVNDSLGHLVGDELLVAVSRRLETCLRQGDALARLGGDEFAILLNGLSDEGQANAIAFRIQEALSAPFSIDGREVFTSASIGIAFGMGQYSNPDEIMRDADIAMYHAKARGKARHELFDEEMHARTRDRLGLENDLRHAVANNALEVHYQPIVSLDSSRCVGFESLVRWNRNGEAVSPAVFIPIAEELGLIEPLGTWVMQQACLTFADWKRRFPDRGLDCITVNVSSRQLMQQGFLRIVEQAVQRARLRPCDLRVEITETALMDSPREVAEVLRELRAFGVKIYLDDFGTGYSSLSHLHTLPVDALKIDRSFVKSLLLPDRPAIVESILALARTLNTSVVAEGIESAIQAKELERLGCTHAQGFLFSRPLPTRSVETLMIANQPLGPEPETESTPDQSCWSVPFDWSEASVAAPINGPRPTSRLTPETTNAIRA